MQPWQKRIVIEEKELALKIDDLGAFALTTMFDSLPAPERDRMHRQLALMLGYRAVLRERIAAFPK